ncbi:hypothetical protein L218DRAFT_737543 [Marasmius fiardii PR-910]|nr:hypothetical protein L218DRAFT_737543 [Marasmius fiardii PR-910]
MMDNISENPWTATTTTTTTAEPQTPPDAFPTLACKVRGCTQPIDIVLETNDGEHISAHITNIEFFTEGFLPQEWSRKVDDVVKKDFSGVVLELLLRFMHNSAAPDLEDERVDIVTMLLLHGASEQFGHLVAL